jgi:hypothetical protein
MSAGCAVAVGSGLNDWVVLTLNFVTAGLDVAVFNLLLDPGNDYTKNL